MHADSLEALAQDFAKACRSWDVTDIPGWVRRLHNAMSTAKLWRVYAVGFGPVLGRRFMAIANAPRVAIVGASGQVPLFGARGVSKSESEPGMSSRGEFHVSKDGNEARERECA